MLSFSRLAIFVRTTIALGLLAAVGTHPANAQAVPVPFAGTYAGGGTVCAASIPVFSATGTGAKYGDGCPATQATLSTPVGVSTDAWGNIYIADQTNNLVRVVYNGGTNVANAIIAANVQTTGLVPTKGNIYTIAGSTSTPATATTYYCNQAASGTVALNSRLDGCPGIQAYVQPRGIASDADGNLFISSVGGGSNVHVLYAGGTKAAALIALENPGVTPQVGYVYVLAGGASSIFAGDGGLAYKASLYNPRGLYVDANENVYITDTQNGLIRVVNGTTGIISTLVGYTGTSRCVSAKACTTTSSSGDGTPATSSTVNLNYPYGTALDSNGNLFIADSGSFNTSAGRVRVVYAAGTLPGISSPVVGNIYTYAGGTAATGTGAQMATFQFVYGIGIDPQGNLFIDDYRSGTAGSNHIWRVSPVDGSITSIAGTGGAALTSGAYCNGGTTGPKTTNTRGDGCPATQAYLNLPQQQPVFDSRGTMYIADRSNNVVRSFTYNNLFPATALGASTTQPLAFLYPTAVTPLTESFTTQSSIASDFSAATGDTCALNTALPVSSTCVNYVKFAPSATGLRNGSIVIAGATGTVASQALSGIGSSALLSIDPATPKTLGTAVQPLGVSADQLGNFYLSDGTGKQVLRTAGIAGTPTAVLTGLGSPRQSTVDSRGNLYVADATNNTIVLLPAGTTTPTTIGTGLAAPQGVAADQLGNLYIADTGNNRLLYVTPSTSNQSVVSTYPYTLSAPTYLALDSAGDLFIVDTNGTRLIEIPFGQQAILPTLPSGTQPTAVAFDAAGELYLTDKTTASLLLLAPGSTTATPLATALSTPTGVAVSVNGDLILADSASTSFATYSRSVNSTVFPTTNISLSSLPVTFTLTDIGNVATALATPPYVETGTFAAAFPATTPATCTGGFALAVGGSCTQSFLFRPTATTTPQTAQVTFNTASAISAVANFSATATNLILTQLTVTGPTTSLTYGQVATYTVTLTPSSTGTTAPSGTITFSVDGRTVTTTNVSTNPYTFTANLGVATHSIGVVYSGDSIYAASNYSTSLTVTKTATTTAVSAKQTAAGTVLTAVVTPAVTGTLIPTGNVTFFVDNVLVATAAVGNGTVSQTVLVADGTHTYYAVYAGDTNYSTSTSSTQSLTIARPATNITLTIAPTSSAGTTGLVLTAVVTGTGGTPTGSVTFSNNGTTLGTVTLPSSGIAVFTTTKVAYTSYSFTAAYSGDGLFQPASVTTVLGPDFVPVSPAATLTVVNGAQATLAMTVTPINGYTGTLTAACVGLPANALCRFTPTPFTLTTTANATLTIQVFTGIDSTLAGHTNLYLVAVLSVLVAICFRRRRSLASLMAVVFLALTFGTTGCGESVKGTEPSSNHPTPSGTSNVIVSLTDTNGLVRYANFTLTVIANQ